ncbi:MAG: four helix bundle protein, partial [candidate division NC10 bacterium]
RTVFQNSTRCGVLRAAAASLSAPVAKGSAFEVVSIAAVCQRRGMISAEKYREIYQRVEDIAKMLSGLKRVGRPA